jgi:hypothetical protein
VGWWVGQNYPGRSGELRVTPNASYGCRQRLLWMHRKTPLAAAASLDSHYLALCNSLIWMGLFHERSVKKVPWTDTKKALEVSC